jgi:protein-S-isoprenylcysteine O-methyltransferase Ste14
MEIESLLSEHGDREDGAVPSKGARQSPRTYVVDETEVTATNPVTCLLHLLTFLLMCVVLRTLLLLGMFDGDLITPTLILILVCGGVSVLVDMVWCKVHHRASTGLDWTKFNPSLSRSLVKLVGLTGSFSVLFFLYWVLPEYSNGDYYNTYYDMLWGVLPVCAPLAAVYVYYVDGYMREPRDGFYHAGLMTLGRVENVNFPVLSQHALSWLVKGFFTPLMFVPLCKDVQDLLTINFNDLETWGDTFGWVYSFLYFTDLHFACIGYIFTFRLVDTHVRAAEGSLFGWVVALMCYAPINTVTGYYFVYGSDTEWGAWLEDTPVLAIFWGSAILLLTLLYTVSTVFFGLRFSNLTNRGIITAGPYAFTKHPAYLCKNLSWWLVSIPFVSSDGWQTAVRKCLGLVFFNGVYLLRAKAEEAMLASDPVYAKYSRQMDRQGMFAGVSALMRRIPVLQGVVGSTSSHGKTGRDEE